MAKKKTSTPLSTITRDVTALSAPVGNIYETVVIISKRANQISSEMKHDLDKKLQDFSAVTDNLEEIHENREQIEVSRYYEKLPKATLRAIKEFEDGKVYYRNPLQSKIAAE
ncbi:MAG: DNA-directed RNA polymerase subunit omega [Prevotellaceae bacterium]|jgi:DNA-directed RNA polymerase subunit K/omega|nr:DNA-directed RNA polymerase subunit omega [Prevotellaceae bacterium]